MKLEKCIVYIVALMGIVLNICYVVCRAEGMYKTSCVVGEGENQNTTSDEYIAEVFADIVNLPKLNEMEDGDVYEENGYRVTCEILEEIPVAITYSPVYTITKTKKTTFKVEKLFKDKECFSLEIKATVAFNDYTEEACITSQSVTFKSLAEGYTLVSKKLVNKINVWNSIVSGRIEVEVRYGGATHMFHAICNALYSNQKITFTIAQVD